MNNHLSSEQISRCVIGDAMPEERRHVNQCKECTAELDRTRAALSDFRSALLDWSDRQRVSMIPGFMSASHAQRRVLWRLVKWAPAAVTLAAITIFPIYRNSLDRARQAQATQDALLLERINTHLSRTAPASLEPLMEMLSDADHKKGESQ